MCINICLHGHLCTSVQCLQKAEGIRPCSTGTTDDHVLTCRWGELNLGPLKEQLLFLTIEPSLQSLLFIFIALNLCLFTVRNDKRVYISNNGSHILISLFLAIKTKN